MTISPALPGRDDVHLWQIALDDARWDRCADVLSEAECMRAAAYREPRARQEFQRGRSALRVLLGRYADQAPQRLVLREGHAGKPELAEHGWHFNLSHSGTVALLAVAKVPVGVDVERIDLAAADTDAIVDMVCHPRERLELAALPETARPGKFYQLWVHKEAYCKALGCGLRCSLCNLYFVAPVGGQGARVMASQAMQPWFVQALALRPGYAASICSAIAAPAIHLFNDSILRRLS